MDRNNPLDPAGSPRAQAGPAEDFVLPSRRAALESCRAALESGPVLITGEPGVGKTWLAERLAVADPRPWIAVDLTPAIGPIELLRALGRRLGLDPGTTDHLALADALSERAADGRCWGLLLDEAHLAPVETLEEVRVLSNRLGRPDGFAAMVLIGQSSLIRRLGTHALAGLGARLAARVHLRPLDADEARDLLARVVPGAAIDPEVLDHLHREVAGNPARLLRRPAVLPASRPPIRLSSPPRPAPRVIPVPADEPESEPEPDLAPELAPIVPDLGSSRPPRTVDAGTIEVGWEPEPKAAADVPSEEVLEVATAPVPEPPRTGQPERIDDHYAALQAWDEWARNQGRTAEAIPPIVAGSPEPALDGEEARPELSGHPNVWSEEQHDFAPYSQLFSRVRQAGGPESL